MVSSRMGFAPGGGLHRGRAGTGTGTIRSRSIGNDEDKMPTRCRVACVRGTGHALVAEGCREVEPLRVRDVRHVDGYVRPKAVGVISEPRRSVGRGFAI